MPPELRRKTFSPKQKQLPNFHLGQKGENHAKTYLLQRGFLVVAENYLSPEGQEIDLIVLEEPHTSQPTLVFIEVKTRSSAHFGSPAQAVDRAKLANLKKAASQFRYQASPQLRNLDFRFDIIAITYHPRRTSSPPLVDHYENISWLK